MNDCVIKQAISEFETPFYLFDAHRFDANFSELESAFRTRYPSFFIAYSFKTNYTPAICKRVLNLGGFAEVVSGMEYELARKIGFHPEQI